MSGTSDPHSSTTQAELMQMGKLVGEFTDVRARGLVIAGYFLVGLGIAIAAMSLLLSGGQVALGCGAPGIIVGSALVSIGKLRSKNRLLIYQGGVAQTRLLRGTVGVLWGDVLELHIERETRFSSGLAYDVRYHCSIRRKDDTWLALDAILVTSSAVKALRASAPVAILFGETDTVVDGRV